MIESENSFYILEIVKKLTRISKECIDTNEIGFTIIDLNQNNSEQLNKGLAQMIRVKLQQSALQTNNFRNVYAECAA